MSAVRQFDKAPRSRRTQAERRQATRAALLNATIEAIVDGGYVGMTTAEVARRAGVTRGAQAHHFSNKADLVGAAMRHLADQLVVEFDERLTLAKQSSIKPLATLLDLVWELHDSDMFAAAFELWAAARSDAELRDGLSSLAGHVALGVASAMEGYLPESIEARQIRQLLSTTMATVRGVAMLRYIRDDVTPEWAAARVHLLTLWSPYV